MRRMLLAAFVLLMIVVAAFAEQRVIGKTCSLMADEAETLAECILNDKGNALIAAQRFEKVWKEKERMLEILTPHEEIDVLDEDLVCLKKSISLKNYDLAGIILEKMRENFEEIYSKAVVDITNIF